MVVISEAIQLLINILNTKHSNFVLEWLLSPTPRLSHWALRSSKSEVTGKQVVFAGIRQMQVVTRLNYVTVWMLDNLKDVERFPLIPIGLGASSTCEETFRMKMEVWRSSAHGFVPEFLLCWILSVKRGDNSWTRSAKRDTTEKNIQAYTSTGK